MYLLLLSIAASVTLLSGLDVRQSPADIIEAVGQKATLKCSHNITSYNQMLWYRQHGVGMQLIGSMYYKTITIESGQEDVKLECNAESGQTCEMIISKLRPSSSAVYYCVASSHGAVNHQITKS